MLRLGDASSGRAIKRAYQTAPSHLLHHPDCPCRERKAIQAGAGFFRRCIDRSPKWPGDALREAIAKLRNPPRIPRCTKPAQQVACPASLTSPAPRASTIPPRTRSASSWKSSAARKASPAYAAAKPSPRAFITTGQRIFLKPVNAVWPVTRPARPKSSAAWRYPPPAYEAAWPLTLPGRQTWPSTRKMLPR